jgi:hypothetical protein
VKSTRPPRGRRRTDHQHAGARCEHHSRRRRLLVASFDESVTIIAGHPVHRSTWPRRVAEVAVLGFRFSSGMPRPASQGRLLRRKEPGGAHGCSPAAETAQNASMSHCFGAWPWIWRSPSAASIGGTMPRLNSASPLENTFLGVNSTCVHVRPAFNWSGTAKYQLPGGEQLCGNPGAASARLPSSDGMSTAEGTRADPLSESPTMHSEAGGGARHGRRVWTKMPIGRLTTIPVG